MDKQFGIIVGLFQLINIGAKGNDIDVVVIANGLHQVIDDDVVAAIAVVIAVVITVVMVAVRVIAAVVVVLFTNAESYHGGRPVFPAIVVFNGNVFCFALYAVCKVLRASEAFRFYLVCFVLRPKGIDGFHAFRAGNAEDFPAFSIANAFFTAGLYPVEVIVAG